MSSSELCLWEVWKVLMSSIYRKHAVSPSFGQNYLKKIAYSRFCSFNCSKGFAYKHSSNISNALIYYRKVLYTSPHPEIHPIQSIHSTYSLGCYLTKRNTLTRVSVQALGVKFMSKIFSASDLHDWESAFEAWTIPGRHPELALTSWWICSTVCFLQKSFKFQIPAKLQSKYDSLSAIQSAIS